VGDSAAGVADGTRDSQQYMHAHSGFQCQINTFGFGYELDCALLHELAVLGGGTYAFIPDAKM
jgi:hypothetical protein